MEKKKQIILFSIIIILVIAFSIFFLSNNEQSKFIGGWTVNNTGYKYTFYDNNSLEISFFAETGNPIEQQNPPNINDIVKTETSFQTINWGTYSIKNNILFISWQNNYYEYRFLDENTLVLTKKNETETIEKINLFKQ